MAKSREATREKDLRKPTVISALGDAKGPLLAAAESGRYMVAVFWNDAGDDVQSYLYGKDFRVSQFDACVKLLNDMLNDEKGKAILLEKAKEN